MKMLLNGAWLLCVALALTGCGGNDRPAPSASNRSATAGSVPSPGEQKPAASDPSLDRIWRQAAALSTTELQAAEKVAAQRSREPSGASGAKAKAVSNRLAVYRFFNSQTSAHFYTSSATERDNVIASLPQFHYEGQAFWAVATGTTGMSPVYRFFNRQTGVHFYTISDDERDFIQASLPQLVYEGVAYYASKTAGTGLSPLYRFYLSSKGFHFYSASAQEADRVRNELPQYTYEGVAYYLPTSDAGSVASFMGSTKVLIGGLMPDATAATAPFDVRYRYIHSRPAASPAYYTDSRCSAEAVASGWWGCWGGTWVAPGNDVTYENNRAAQVTWQGSPRPQIFFWTWYSLRDLGDMAGHGDGPGEVEAINRLDLLTLYMNDYRFFLQKIGNSRNMIDLEPDFWGYVRSLGNPHNVPAQVAGANPTDCATEENSAAGLARCLISMARKYAPNTAVGMHVSCWDWQNNTQGCRQDYLNLGAANADFLVADVSDRDAGWYALPEHGGYNNFWTDEKAAATLAFYKTMAETVGKPMVLWQIPVGNMAQNNTINHFQDDKVDWFFSHMDQVADAHIAALLFGAGHHEQTGPEHDGGNLVNKTINLWNAGGTPLR